MESGQGQEEAERWEGNTQGKGGIMEGGQGQEETAGGQQVA